MAGFSTKTILTSLPSLTRGQMTASSFAKHSDDSKGGRSVNRPTNISDVIEDGRTEDALQYKMQPPKLTPKSKQTLTPEEEKQLAKEFASAESLLNNFKELLRQEGVDISNLSVFKTLNNRISYYIPERHLSRFSVFMTNKIAPTKQLDTQEIELSKRRGMRM